MGLCTPVCGTTVFTCIYLCGVLAVYSLQVHLLMCWAYCNDNVKTASRHVITLLTALLRDESVSSTIENFHRLKIEVPSTARFALT